MDSVTAMRTFALVVSLGNFSTAARHLGVAPSSVSRQINELEADLGINLFQRSTRTLSLTEAGQIYHDRIIRILDDIEETKLALSELQSPSGILRVTVPTGIGREIIVSALPLFLEKYPGIQVAISMTDNVIDIVESGYDVGIRVGNLKDSSIKARKIGNTQRIACASPSYLARSAPLYKPSDLVDHNCISFRQHPGSSLWKFRNEEDGNETSVSVRGNVFARSADALVSSAIAGLGIVLLPDWNIRTELATKRLVRVLPNFNPSPDKSPVWAVHTHHRHVPPKIRAFVDFLVDVFSG